MEKAMFRPLAVCGPPSCVDPACGARTLLRAACPGECGMSLWACPAHAWQVPLKLALLHLRAAAILDWAAVN